MATAYPGALDSFDVKVDNVDDVEAIDINDVQEAIEALETKVGVDGSAVEASHDFKHTIIEDMTDGQLVIGQTGSYGETKTVSGDATIDKDGVVAIGNDKIDSQHYVADSIDTEHYAPGSVDVAAMATPMQMKTGTYEGDDNDNRSINIGIDLDAATYVYATIKRDDSTDLPVFRYGHMPGDLTYQFAAATPTTNKIQAFTATGFQVGSHTEVNALNHTYDYMVIYQA